MMERIYIKFLRSDGGVSLGEMSPEADIAVCAHQWEEANPPGDPTNPMSGLKIVAHELITESELAHERHFRNARKPDGTHDMTKCRAIHKDNLRRLRAPKLAALDIDYDKADEDGNQVLKAQIAAKKKALRNVTADPRIAAATTPEQLKAVIPDVLT
mgnify:CR=1 FL=1